MSHTSGPSRPAIVCRPTISAGVSIACLHSILTRRIGNQEREKNSKNIYLILICYILIWFDLIQFNLAIRISFYGIKSLLIQSKSCREYKQKWIEWKLENVQV